MGVGCVFVNQVVESPVSPGEVSALDALEARARAAGEAVLVRDCALGRRAMRMHAACDRELSRLAAEVSAPQVVLPQLGAVDIEALARLGAIARARGEAHP